MIDPLRPGEGEDTPERFLRERAQALRRERDRLIQQVVYLENEAESVRASIAELQRLAAECDVAVRRLEQCRATPASEAELR